VRHGVLGFACGLSLITYLDRICISRVSGDIRRDLGLSDPQMGLVYSAFTLGYLIFEVPGGWMGDAWGSRRVLTRIVIWWSVFTALTGCVWAFTIGNPEGFLYLNGGLVVLLLVRFLFGCGEAGAYPNLARVVGGWFPFNERGLALGAIWTSARLGGAIAPFVIGRLTFLLGGWRPAFWVLGIVGIVWALIFYRWFRNTPEEHPGCNSGERELIRAGPYAMSAADGQATHAFPPWRSLLLNVNVWAMSLSSAGVSFGWYFYATWQLDFLKEEHHVTIEQTEILGGLPFLSGAAGALLGGGLSDRLVRVAGRRWGRSLIGVFGFGGAGFCVLLAGQVPALWLAVTLLCLGTFINDMAVPVMWAVCADIGGRYAGTVSGIMNMVGGLGPLVSQPLIPVWRTAYGWPAALLYLSLSFFVAGLAWLAIDASKPVENRNANTGSPRPGGGARGSP